MNLDGEMTRNQIAENLKRVYMNLPQDFSLREVKFYVYKAIQGIEHVMKKDENRAELQKNEVRHSEVKTTITPALFPQKHVPLRETLDIIDQMIKGEEAKIAEIAAKKGKRDEPPQGNMQTYLG